MMQEQGRKPGLELPIRYLLVLWLLVLSTIAFLDRTERLFHLWHVIHRPFSISFVLLIAVHIGVAVSVGF